MYYHPTVLILLAAISLAASIKYSKLFATIALGYPIIAAIILTCNKGVFSFLFYGLEFISDFSTLNKLIGLAFLFVLFVTNLYCFGKDKKFEIILGAIYGAFSFLSLLAGDFISIFIGLELMMLSSTAIILIGGKKESLRSAKKYFITHLISSNMIIIGIAYIIQKTGSIAIVDVAALMLNPEYSKPFLLILLAGLIINIAAFPFSGWMVNYYQSASPSGFLYLITFTTKISLILLLKLFAGYEALKFIAVIMILSSSIHAIVENRLQGLLCHLSIIQMGFMLLGISNGSFEALYATSIYLFMHIIYKSLLSLACTTLIDDGRTLLCSDLKKINEPAISIAFMVGIALMINVPLSATWYAKTEISYAETNNFIYFIIILSSVTTICALPLRYYFNSTQTSTLLIGTLTKISLYLMSFIAFIVGFFSPFIPVINNIHSVNIFSLNLIKQVVLIALAIGIVCFVKITKKHLPSINLIEWLGQVLLRLHYLSQSYYSSPIKKENWSIKSLEQQVFGKFAILHNQQTAIFMVFSVLVILLLTLKFI